MKRLKLACLLIALCMCMPAGGQDAVTALLANANALRARLGLPAYALDAALNAAAGNHARWMAANNRVDHVQPDGSNARTRARAAGFPSSWVGENIYMGSGASPSTAWNWWLNSPVHYAGLVSPNYDRVGIGSASAGGRTAYVMVFGNASGRLSQAGSPASGSQSASPAQPAFVLGLDERGNIRHEVQPGHTIGDIALIYGYTWDDIPAMLALNDMSWEEIRWLQPGSQFLVPPKAGTYTPTAPPTATAAATATAEATARATRAQASVRASPPAPSPSPRPRLELRIERPESAAEVSPQADYRELLLLLMAMLAQAGLIAGLSLLLWRWR